MLLLDEIVEWEHERIVCKKTFQPDEWFFQGHYPNFPIVPGVMLCEAAIRPARCYSANTPRAKACRSLAG